MDDQHIDVSPDEQIAEQEALKEVVEDDLRTKLAEEFELDQEKDAAKLDKLVKRETEHRKKLSSAIKQKIKYRDEAKKLPPSNKQGSTTTEDSSDLMAKMRSLLEEERLQELDLPEEIKTEVRDLAQFKKISVKEAVKNPYIQSRLKELNITSRIVDSSVSGASGARGNNSTSFDPDKPPVISDYNVKDPKEFEKYKRDKAEWQKKRNDMRTS